MAVEKKTMQDPDFGEVTLRRNSRARRIIIRIANGKVSITVPWRTPYSSGIAFLESRRAEILQRVKNTSREAPTAEQIEKIRKAAKAVLPYRVMELASKYGFKVNRVTIKNNYTNWGSCSTKGNINLNLRLVLLPSHLKDSVILHELCHLRYMNHSKDFHALLEDLCLKETGYHEKDLASELKRYKML